MTDGKLEAARAMAKLIFETNAEEADRLSKKHIAGSERKLIALVDNGDLDSGYTIARLLREMNDETD